MSNLHKLNYHCCNNYAITDHNAPDFHPTRITTSVIVNTKKQYKGLLRCYLIIALLITSMSPLANANTDANFADTFTLNLTNVDIRSLIETVSKQTGKNFIVDPRVKATVTVVSATPVNANKLYEMFLSVLDVHGYAAVPAGSVTKIVPMATGVQSAVPVITDKSESGDELVTRVVQVNYVPAQKLSEALRPLLPQTATVGAEPNSNTVVITDSADNIERVVEIIRLLDRAR